MSRLTYDSADVLVYDPVAPNRNATRAALFTLGFRRIETVGELDVFFDAVRRRPPDLALCEAQGAESDFCGAIQRLRQGAGGFNPFIVIIVTAWERTGGLVARVVDSGADDLLLRPFSTALLGQRIESHIERRKRFIVTSQYVGPDRRQDMGRVSGSVMPFEPPNSLKMKAKDRMSPEEVALRLDTELKGAKEKLNAEKLRRDSFQLCVQWYLTQTDPLFAGGDSIAAIAALARATAKRARDLELPDAAEWCESILAAVHGIAAGVDRGAALHLLGHASLSLAQLFHDGRTVADIAVEVEATVALIKARSKLQADLPVGMPLPLRQSA